MRKKEKMTDVQSVRVQSLYGTFREGILYAQTAGSYYLSQFSPMIGPTTTLIGISAVALLVVKQNPQNPFLIPLISGIFISMKSWLHSLSQVHGSITQTSERLKTFLSNADLPIPVEAMSKMSVAN